MLNPIYAAERVLNELGINSPKDLERIELIAWARGALVREKHLDGAEARLTVLGKRAVITISTTIRDPRRKRFSIAHELGHLELHRRWSSLMPCLSEDIDNWGDLRRSGADLEQEANEFAAALLLPERFLAPLCRGQDPSLDHVAELAEAFNVSLTATALRYLDFCDEPIAVVFSQDGRVKWFRGNKHFEELGLFVEVRSRLDPSSHAALFFQGRTIPTGPKQVDASAWLAPGRYRPDARIQEHSVAMPNYNAVLTLLWIDDDIEDDEDFVWL